MHGIHFSSQWSHDERKNDGWPSAINFREQESDQNFHIFLEHQQRGRMNNTTAFENHGMNAQSFLNTSQYQSPPDRNWDFQRDKNSRYFSNEIPIMNFRQGDSNTARFEENSRAIDKSRYHPSPHGYQGNTFQNGNDFNIRNASQYLVQNNPPSKSSSYKINIIEQSEQPKLKENDEKSLENNQKVIKKMSRVERRYAESAADPHPDFVYVVQFKRDFRGYTPHKNSAQLQYHVGDVVLTNTHQGDDIGIVTDILSVAELAERRRVADLRTAALGCEPKEETYIGHILSVATTAQRKQQAQLRLEEQEVMKVKENCKIYFLFCSYLLRILCL